MNPFEDLSGDNHDQIRKYLRFFRQKKDGIIREIDREFIDIRNDKLEETMFTKEDMLEYSDHLASAIKVCVAEPHFEYVPISRSNPCHRRFCSLTWQPTLEQLSTWEPLPSISFYPAHKTKVLS
jgi:hypothetical protein